MNVDQSTVSLQEKRENTWTVSVDENKIDVLFNHVSKKKSMCGKYWRCQTWSYMFCKFLQIEK